MLRACPTVSQSQKIVGVPHWDWENHGPTSPNLPFPILFFWDSEILSRKNDFFGTNPSFPQKIFVDTFNHSEYSVWSNINRKWDFSF